MHRPVFVAMMAVAVTLTGCKIVKNPDPEAADAVAATQTDEERMAVYAAELWEPRVLPAVQDHLVPLFDLRAALAADVDAAGAAHGMRPYGEANPWNFAVSGGGTIIDANPESRAAKLQVDTDGDGAADVTIQLGPVIRGTALRDAMPFLLFTDFRDQIEFAKLAGGLNAMAHGGVTVPDGELIGQTVTFEGVFTFAGVDTIPEIVPTALTFGAP